MNDSEADSRADSHRFGRVKGVEDMGLAFGRNPAAVIGDANAYLRPRAVNRFLDPRSNGDLPMLRYGVYGVVEKVGPYLIQTGACGLEDGKIGGQILFYDDLLLPELVAEDDEG